VDEFDVAAGDVVEEPEAAEAEAPLAIAWLHVGELLDVVLSTDVRGVRREDPHRASEQPREFGMLPVKPPREAVEMGDRADRKARRHAR
jgi:hypothetical protein